MLSTTAPNRNRQVIQGSSDLDAATIDGWIAALLEGDFPCTCNFSGCVCEVPATCQVPGTCQVPETCEIPLTCTIERECDPETEDCDPALCEVELCEL